MRIAIVDDIASEREEVRDMLSKVILIRNWERCLSDAGNN